MMGIPTKEWGNIPYPGLMFFQNFSQKVLNMEPITYKVQKLLSRNKRKINTMCVVYIILDDTLESGIDENWCLLNNQ